MSPAQTPKGVQELLNGIFRDDGLNDGSPEGDILGGVGVGVFGMIAVQAKELRLRLPISLFNMPALETPLTGVAGMNTLNLDAGKDCLVFDESAQLSECPVGTPRSFLLALSRSSPCPRSLSNVGQVFDTERTLRALGFQNKPLGENVVRVSLVASLLLGKFAKMTLGGKASPLLKGGAKPLMALSVLLDGRGGITVSVAGGDKGIDTEVRTKRLPRLLFRRVGHIAGREKVELVVYEYQVGLAPTVGKQFALPFPTDKGKPKATRKCPNTDKALVYAPAKDSVIVRHRSAKPERRLNLLILGVSRRYLRGDMHRRLRGKSELVADFAIDQFLQLHAPEGLGCEGTFAGVITRRVERLHRGEQKRLLRLANNEFNFRC